MPMLDVFKSDIFGVVSLTTSINKLPYVPSRLAPLFRTEGISTTTVVVEEQRGKLMIVPTAARGTSPNVMGGRTRKAKSFLVPHIPLEASIMADDVQNVRAFGSETEIETVAKLTNLKLADMRQAMELTHEWHRIGAIKGIVIDADTGGTELFNWFTEFGISEEVIGIDFTDEDDVKLKANAVRRLIEDRLGATPYKTLRAFCGSTIFDTLCTSEGVKKAFDRWQESIFLRESQARTEFEYAGVMWEEYRGAIGSTKFVGDDEIRFFPEGVTDLFETYFAPADWMETVNTMGKPVYSKQAPRKWDTGVDFQTQSNPLTLCSRPSVLVRGFDEAVGS
jgi:hypothetical protein